MRTILELLHENFLPERGGIDGGKGFADFRGVVPGAEFIVDGTVSTAEWATLSSATISSIGISNHIDIDLNRLLHDVIEFPVTLCEGVE